MILTYGLVAVLLGGEVDEGTSFTAQKLNTMDPPDTARKRRQANTRINRTRQDHCVG